MRFLWAFLLILGACSPSSHTDFVQEADAICKHLIEHLQKIEHPQDLTLAEKRLTQDFEELIDVVIAARKKELQKPEDFSVEILECSGSEDLKTELMRVFEIEGGRALVEKAQREAINRLDRFEHLCNKKKNRVKT